MPEKLLGRRESGPLTFPRGQFLEPGSHQLEFPLPAGQPLRQGVDAAGTAFDCQSDVLDARRELPGLGLKGPTLGSDIAAGGMQLLNAGHQQVADAGDRHQRIDDLPENRWVSLCPETSSPVPAGVPL